MFNILIFACIQVFWSGLFALNAIELIQSIQQGNLGFGQGCNIAVMLLLASVVIDNQVNFMKRGKK